MALHQRLGRQWLIMAKLEPLVGRSQHHLTKEGPCSGKAFPWAPVLTTQTVEVCQKGAVPKSSVSCLVPVAFLLVPNLKVEPAEGVGTVYTVPQKLRLCLIHFNHLPFNWLFTNG